MPKKKKSESTLVQQLAGFKERNPKVAEAMELFGITMTKYQESLHSLYGPHVYTSNSTVKLDKSNQ